MFAPLAGVGPSTGPASPRRSHPSAKLRLGLAPPAEHVYWSALKQLAARPAPPWRSMSRAQAVTPAKPGRARSRPVRLGTPMNSARAAPTAQAPAGLICIWASQPRKPEILGLRTSRTRSEEHTSELQS